MLVIVYLDDYLSNLIACVIVLIVVPARGQISRAIPKDSYSLTRFGRGTCERLHRAS